MNRYMRTWTRVTVTTLCGGCRGFLTPGAPIELTTLPGVRHDRRRGVCCAGPAPPDLPAKMVRTSPEETRGLRQRLARLGSLAGRAFAEQGSLTPVLIHQRAMRDVKQAQANEREPGEEG